MSTVNFSVKLHVLTPVIINSGEVYEFCELYPQEKAFLFNGQKAYSCWQLELSKLFEGLNGQQANTFVSQSCSGIEGKNDKTLCDARSMIKNVEKKVLRPCKAFEQAYHVIHDKPMQQIAKIMTNPRTGKPYLPGSSIKGAMRTGFLDTVRDEKGITESPSYPNYQNSRNFEASLYGQDQFKVGRDPFKYLRVSDFDFEDNHTDIFIGKVGEDARMPIYTAMTSCEWVLGKEVIANGTIQIDERFFSEGRLKNIAVSSFFAAVSDYFLGTARKARWQVVLPEDRWDKVEQELQGKGYDRAFLLKVGHYSGIQNCTFHIQNANPRGKNKDPNINIDGGKIVACVENGLPPGFCLMRVTPVS